MSRALWWAANEHRINYASIALDVWDDDRPETQLTRYQARRAIARLRFEYTWFDDLLESLQAGRTASNRQVQAVYAFLRHGTADLAANELRISPRALAGLIWRFGSRYPGSRRLIADNRRRGNKYVDALDGAGSGRHLRPPLRWVGERSRQRYLGGKYDSLVSVPILGPNGDGNGGPGRLPLLRSTVDDPYWAALSADVDFAKIEQDDLADPKDDPKGLRLQESPPLRIRDLPALRPPRRRP